MHRLNSNSQLRQIHTVDDAGAKPGQTRCVDQYLQLESAQPADSPDPVADAAAKRHRSLEHHAQKRLTALFTPSALMA